jgi:hypothetical protein
MPGVICRVLSGAGESDACAKHENEEADETDAGDSTHRDTARDKANNGAECTRRPWKASASS